MKKIMLFVLAFLMVFGLCSCKKSPHRKLEFDDGTSYCFTGSVSIHEDYVSIGFGTETEYFSLNDRAFTITECDCENINN